MTRSRVLIAILLFLSIARQGRSQDLSQIGKNKPFSYSGNLGSRLVFYDANGIPNRRDPFGYVISGALNVSVYEWTLPFSFSYSNQGSVYGQPFNQFGVSPTYKWATLHLGYRNVTHSSLTLAGHQILGAGFDLNPKKLRLGFMYGRFRKATQFRPPPDSLSLDTLLQTYKIPLVEDPVYKRTGWSAKVGYGDNNGFVDLILLKAADDPTSITDDSLKKTFRPAANAVMGINARKTFFNRLTLYFEGAISAFTRDRELKDESDSTDNALAPLFRSFIPINSATYYYRAVKAGLMFTHTKFNLQADYQKIDPDYQSMGAYYFNSDIEMINVTPSFFLLKNKVIVTSGFSYQHDNLKEKKALTTSRIIPRVNVSINPSYRYGFDLGYQDMLTNQASGITEVSDSLRMRMHNPGITLGARYNIIDSLRTHTFMVMLNQFSLKDNNVVTQPYSEYTATIINFNYNFFLTKKSLGINVSITSNRLDSFNGTDESAGVAVGGSKGFKEDKLTLNATWSANFSEAVSSQSINAGVAYLYGKKLTLSANVNYLMADQQGKTFSELTGFVECRYTFGKRK